MPRRLALYAVVSAAACGGSDDRPDYDRTGAIEVILAFRGVATPATFTSPDPAEVRRVLVDAGQRDITIERMQVRVDDAMRPALRVMVAFAEWPPPTAREEAVVAIKRQWPDVVTKVAWAGNRLFIRSTQAIDQARLRAILDGLDIVVLDAISADVDAELGEHQTVAKIGFTDVRIERALEARMPDTDVVVTSTLMVGPRR